MEFLNTLGAMLSSFWDLISRNKDGIVAFVTSADFIAGVGVVIALIKNIISCKANTESNDQLKKSNDEVKQVLNTVNETLTAVLACQVALADLTSKVTVDDKEIFNKCEDLKSKLNSIIEAQMLVYSTIHDENIRTAVQGHLIAAKFSEPNVQEKLNAEMENMRVELDTVLRQIGDIGKNTAEAVRTISTSQPIEKNEESTPIRRA
jgi:uncharacterized membrane-anchored protein YhcB (DUF1043 family)